MKTLNDYMKMSYRMEIVEDQDEGGFVVSYPDLPGCITLRGDHRKCSGKCGGCKKGMAGGSFGGRNRNLRAGWSGSVFRSI